MQLSPQLALSLGALLSAPGSVLAQQFAQNDSAIPQGNPINTGETENIDFGDIDLDGDWDAAFANGGDSGNQQNRLWLNRGPLLPGIFSDVTNLRFPLQPDASRDVEFVDFDGDGDPDIYIANDAQLVNQSCRWWHNTGIGSGAFVDETASRWLDLGDNDGLTSSSSISALLVLPAGGFIDWVADGDFADLDNDGDLDLFHASYGSSYSGNTPSRIFFNDGLGHFTEHNPSGFQLPSATLPSASLPSASLPTGSPALWAEGLHIDNTLDTDGSQADITSNGNDTDLMDIDGDLDIDIVFGNQSWPSRLFINRLEEQGSALFRDETFARLAKVSSGALGYEQELGDVDGDGDYDIFVAEAPNAANRFLENLGPRSIRRLRACSGSSRPRTARRAPSRPWCACRSSRPARPWPNPPAARATTRSPAPRSRASRTACCSRVSPVPRPLRSRAELCASARRSSVVRCRTRAARAPRTAVEASRSSSTTGPSCRWGSTRAPATAAVTSGGTATPPTARGRSVAHSPTRSGWTSSRRSPGGSAPDR